MAPKAFSFAKISDHGSSNPIIARLVLQTEELIGWSKVGSPRKSDILALCLRLSNRLLNCQSNFENLRKQIEEQEEEFNAGADGWVDGRIPHIIDLDNICESFLYSSKLFLRDLSEIAELCFGCTLARDANVFGTPKEGKKPQFLEWIEKNIVNRPLFIERLREDQTWIVELIRKRNAVEHPGERSGTLIISNYKLVSQGVIPPSWKLDLGSDCHETAIYSDMQTYVENMLSYAEELIVISVVTAPLFPMIQIIEIPPENRDPGNPIRFRPTVSGLPSA